MNISVVDISIPGISELIFLVNISVVDISIVNISKWIFLYWMSL